MFGGGLTTVGALSAFANSGNASTTANSINNGFANALSNNKPPVLNGTNIANSINSGFGSNSASTTGSNTMLSTMKNIADAAYTIVNRIETTNNLLQKLIDIGSGKIQQNDINKIAMTNNRISVAMSRTAMGRLAMAVMARQLGRSMGQMDYRLRGAIQSGVTSNKEILTAKLLGNLPLLGQMFTSMKEINDKLLKAKDVFTNETNVSITGVIPKKLEAIGTYTRDIRDFIKANLYKEMMLQTQALIQIHNTMDRGLTEMLGRSGNRPPNNGLIIPGGDNRPAPQQNTTNAITKTDIINALATYDKQQEELLSEQLKSNSKIVAASIQMVDAQRRETELSEKLNVTSDKILNANVKNSILLSTLVTKLPNLLSKGINSALKISLMMGIGRTIFRAFGADKIAENISTRGAIGFIGATKNFISNIINRFNNSEVGKSINQFISKQIETIKEKAKEVIKYTMTQMFRVYNTFVLFPMFFRQHLLPSMIKGLDALKRAKKKQDEVTTSLLYTTDYEATKAAPAAGKSLTKTIFNALGKVGSVLGTTLRFVGWSAIIFRFLKDVIGTAFNAWKLTKSKEELKNMNLTDQIAGFVGSIFSGLTKTIGGTIRFLWRNLGPIVTGFVKGIFNFLWEGIKSAAQSIWGFFTGGKSEEQQQLRDAIEEQQREREAQEEAQKNTTDAIKESTEEAKKNTNSIKNVLVENLANIGKTIHNGFKYVIKIFDLIKPKTLGTIAGNVLGSLREFTKIFMTDEEKAAFDVKYKKHIAGKISAINEKVFTINPKLKDTVKFDELGRPISGDTKGYFSVLNEAGMRAAFEQAMYDMLGYSAEGRWGEQFKESTKDTIIQALNDDQIKANELLKQIETNTGATALYTKIGFNITKSLAELSVKGDTGTIDLVGDRYDEKNPYASNFTRQANTVKFLTSVPSASNEYKDINEKFFTPTNFNSENGILNEMALYGGISKANTMNEYLEDLIKNKGLTSTGIGQAINSDIFDNMSIGDDGKTKLSDYIRKFAPLNTKIANVAGTVSDYNSYYGRMHSDLRRFYEYWRDSIRGSKISDEQYEKYNSIEEISPDRFFRSILSGQISKFARENPDFYSRAFVNPEEYNSFIKAIEYHMMSLGYAYGDQLKEYADLMEQKSIGKSDSTTLADNIKRSIKNLTSLREQNDSLLISPINKSLDAAIEKWKLQRFLPQQEQGDNVSYGDWRTFKPRKFNDWRDTIYQAAIMTGMDPEIISSIIQQESGGRPTAKSRAGAYGLMQVMAAAQIDANKYLGGNYDRFTPEDNIFLGTAYINQMLNGSSLIDGLMKYNWGPGNFGKWKKVNGPLSKVPTETRQYPGKVLQYYGMHKFTDAAMPINKEIHTTIRNAALIQAGLKGAINVAQGSVTPPSASGNMEGNGPTTSSDHRARAAQYLVFRGTNIDKFMKVNPLLREPFLRYAEEMFRTKNKRVMVTSTYRSMAEQQALWNNRHNNPYTVGKPSQYNKHNLGLAIDVNSKDGSIDPHILNKYGMVRPVRNDPVHIEMREWAGQTGPKVIQKFGNYPQNIGATEAVAMSQIPMPTYEVTHSNTTEEFQRSMYDMLGYNRSPITTSSSLGELITTKLQNLGINTNNPDPFANSMALLGLGMDGIGDNIRDGENTAIAEPVNYTGLTAGLRNTTFENELAKINIAGISNAQMRKISGGNTSPLESQLTKVMTLLAKKTVENNELMKQIVATNNTTNNVVTVNTNQNNNSAVSSNSGNGAGSNIDNSSIFGGNDMGLRALYI